MFKLFKRKKIIDDVPSAVKFLFNSGYIVASREIFAKLLSNKIELIANDKKCFIIRNSVNSKRTYEVEGKIVDIFIDQYDHLKPCAEIRIYVQKTLKGITNGIRS